MYYLRYFLLLSIFLSTPIFPWAQLTMDLCKIAHNEGKAALPSLMLRNKSNPIDVVHQRLNVAVDPNVNYIAGDVTTSLLTKNNSTQSVTLDLATTLSVDSVLSENGKKLLFAHTPLDKLVINLDTLYEENSLVVLQVFYHGQPNDPGFGSFKQETHPSGTIIWTLSEPFGAKEWWPCNQDLEDKVETVDILVTVPTGNEVAANGVLIETESLADNKIRYHWQHKYPIATYLIGFAASNYVVHHQTVELQEGNLPITNYLYPNGAEANKLLLENQLPGMMQLMDSLFLPYPYIDEKYGHAQFGFGGGIEHQTISFVKDFRYSLMAHELAHQWFGDYITCGSWEDIWLNEGFAVYSTALIYQYVTKDGRWERFIAELLGLVVSQESGSVKVSDTTSIDRIFNPYLSYYKGALVLHMVRGVIGDEHFFNAIRQYLRDEKLKFGFAKTPDLIAHLEATSQMDLTEFFQDWYEGEGYPSYHLQWNQNDEIVTIDLSQTTSHPSVDFYEMPVQIKFIGTENDTIITLDHQYDHQMFQVSLPMSVKEIVIDPDKWIVSKNNTVDVLSNSNHIVDVDHKIYPNPAQNQTVVQFEHPYMVQRIEMYSTNGKKVKQFIFDDKSLTSVTLPINDLLSGIYFIQIKYSNKTTSIHELAIIK